MPSAGPDDRTAAPAIRVVPIDTSTATERATAMMAARTARIVAPTI